MSFNSSSGGGEWSNKLTWYPNAQFREGRHAYCFTEDQENVFFQQCSYRLSQEFVQQIYFFKTPLSPGHFRTYAFARIFVDLLLPDLEYKLVHVYVIVRTNTGKVFCFSKAASGIEVLCGGDMDILHKSQHQPDAEKSFDPVPAKGQSLPYVDISRKSYTVEDMVRRIFRTGEITKGYQTFSENCKDFACRLFNHFSPYEVPISSV